MEIQMWPFKKKPQQKLNPREFLHDGNLYRFIKIDNGYMIEKRSKDALGELYWNRWSTITPTSYLYNLNADLLLSIFKMLENKE